jgi:hypothetical protein
MLTGKKKGSLSWSPASSHRPDFMGPVTESERIIITPSLQQYHGQAMKKHGVRTVLDRVSWSPALQPTLHPRLCHGSRD